MQASATQSTWLLYQIWTKSTNSSLKYQNRHTQIMQNAHNCAKYDKMEFGSVINVVIMVLIDNLGWIALCHLVKTWSTLSTINCYQDQFAAVCSITLDGMQHIIFQVQQRRSSKKWDFWMRLQWDVYVSEYLSTEMENYCKWCDAPFCSI